MQYFRLDYNEILEFLTGRIVYDIGGGGARGCEQRRSVAQTLGDMSTDSWEVM
jgi:hypothetical protein